jgi:NTP pyrophosphatase (non-canonical NTP hydrolase)
MVEEILNEYCIKSYQAAHAKGFFTDDRDDAPYLVAIHEELSEAFSAWNKHKGWLAYGAKPDGVYFELVDAVIRVFSYCGYKGLSLHETIIETDRPYMQDDLCDMIAKCHLDLAQYYDLLNKESRDEFEAELQVICMQNLLSNFVARIEMFIEQTLDDTDIVDLIDIKLAYNATRGIKHGGNEV